MYLKSKLYTVLWILLAISFLAKIAVGYTIRDSFSIRGNSHSFLNPIAKNLAESNSFSVEQGIPSVDYEPAYPFLMRLAYSFSIENWLSLTLLQALLHGLTSFLIFLIGKKIWNETAGFFGAVFHAFYPYLFMYSLSIYDTTLFVFILVALFYIIVNEKYTTIHLLIAGILCGLGFLTRGTTVTFLPPIFIFILYFFYKQKKTMQGPLQLSLLVIAMIATMAPWLIRNHDYTGRWFVSTHGPFGIWQGNNDLTYNYLSNDITLDEVYRHKPTPEIYVKFPIKSRYPAEAVAVADEYKKEAQTWISSHPQMFVKLAFLKAQKLWTWNRNPSSITPEFGSNEGRGTVNTISYLPLFLSLPFGIYFLYKKRKPVALLIAGILVCFTAAHMVAMGFTRARLPIDPILMICFGIAADVVISRFNKNQPDFKTTSLEKR